MSVLLRYYFMDLTLEKIFYPKSIAVVGASSKEGTLSWELMNNLLKFGFQGQLFPVNPKSPFVHSMKAYKSLTDIQDDVDLAIIMVPRHLVLAAIEDCHKKGISAVVVITAGFKEVGGDGIELENRVIEKIKEYKMRLVGPNCMGLINTRPDVNMNATFVLGNPIPGGIGFMSQSGALGAAVLKTVQQNDIGLSQFISLGNKADISGNAVLDFWKDNPDIKVITVYLESFGDPRGFMERTREITKTKPVIVVKSARTAAGERAASSHTGALATADTVVDAFLNQGGVIRVNTIEEMFDLAKAFDRATLPEGNRLGILTNAGGPAILAVDEAQRCGLTIPELSKETQEKLREFAPPEAALGNPVDLLPPATARMWGEATRLMLKDENIDSLLVILGPPLMLDTAEIAHAICEGAKYPPCPSGIPPGRGLSKPVMLVLMSQDDIIPRLRLLDPEHPPVFRYPESAARAIGEMLVLKKWQKMPRGERKYFEVEKEEVRKILDNVGRSGASPRSEESLRENTVSSYIDYQDVYKILQLYGFPAAESYLATKPEESVSFAHKIGYPVVVKAFGEGLIHKTEAGAVALNITSDNDLLKAEQKMLAGLRTNGHKFIPKEFLIQPYIQGGIEMIMGVSKDPKAGHLIMFGLGGTFVEVFNDVKFKLLPITDVEASELVRSVKSCRLLEGVRGAKPIDIKFVEENLLRLSQLIEDFPEIIEVDFNPFIFFPERNKCRIVDARMKIIRN
jgi:acetyl coenzyme A synthetase (ADP forming)-like protein